MKPQDHVIYRYDCQICTQFEHRTIKYPERNYGTGMTRYQTTHATGWDAIDALIKYCNDEGIEVEIPNDDWKKYFSKMDSHLQYMIKKKGTVSDGEWKMAFSCDAPNKPGYYRANND